MPDSHEKLLADAVRAHEKHLATVEASKRERQAAFKRAVSGTVTARELSQKIGISDTQVSRIAAGKA